MKVKFKVHPKCSDTELEILLNMTTWDIYKCKKTHLSPNIEDRIEAFNNIGYKNPISIVEVGGEFEYSIELDDKELFSYKLRKLYYQNNGLLDDHPEDRIESRTDWNELDEMYSTLMCGISELMNI